MKAGELDRRLTLLVSETSDDGFGTVETFFETVTVWAAKKDVSDGERWRAGQVQATVTTRFRVRWSVATAALSERDRVRCEGLTYDVVATKEIGRREGIEITAAARSDMET